MQKRIQDKDIEFFLFVLFFIFMVIYYAYRIFAHSPWYDELYTYYFFISRGPIYSAIHWPVPNNHIGYSVISGFIYELTHNSFVSLRGLSFLASSANIVLIFAFCRRLFNRNYSIVATALYAGMWLVNNLSVQGRGYSLSTTMMLMCAYALVCIALDGEVRKKYYVFWTIALCYGLYIVSSSLYWVIPICICAGISLLILKRYRELIKLIACSFVSAFATALLYLIVWLAIGSNLLIKESAEFTGMGHVKLISNHPVKAAARGIEYMLATPYIQSVSKVGYRNSFGDHWITLLGQMYGATSIVLIGVFMSVVFAAVWIAGFFLYMHKQDDESQLRFQAMKKDLLLAVFVLTMVVFTPAVVFMQVKLPYYRVFSFYGVTVAVALTFVLYTLFAKVRPAFTFVIPVLFIVFSIAQLISADYNESYGYREQAAYDLMVDNDLTEYRSVAITDCNQEYMYKFVYGIQNENRDIESSEAIIIEKSMLDPEGEEAWEFYYDYNTLPLNDINNRTLKYENDFYALYIQ